MSKHRAATPSRRATASTGRHRAGRAPRRWRAPHALAAGVGTLGATGAATVVLLAAVPGEEVTPDPIRSSDPAASSSTSGVLWPALDLDLGPVARTAPGFTTVAEESVRGAGVGAGGLSGAVAPTASASTAPAEVVTSTPAPTPTGAGTPGAPDPSAPGPGPGGPSRGPDVPVSTPTVELVPDLPDLPDLPAPDELVGQLAGDGAGPLDGLLR